LKPERWRSPLVQEKYREEKPVTRDIHINNNNNNNNNNNRIYPCPLSCLPLAMKFDCKRRRIGHSTNRINVSARYAGIARERTCLPRIKTMCNKTAVTTSIVQELGMLYHPFCKSLQQNESTVCHRVVTCGSTSTGVE